MDYTTIPIRLIYNPRFSLRDFGVYNNHPINTPFAESMLKWDVLQGKYAEHNVLRCLNDAYYITTMILKEEDPRWRMGNYKNIVKENLIKSPDAYELFSLSLVSAYLRALSKDLTPLAIKFSDILFEYVSNHYLIFKYSIDAWMSPKVRLNPNDFAPRYIDKMVIYELEQDDFSWVDYTKNFDEQFVREIISGLGETGEEKMTLLLSINEAAQEYYERNTIYQNVVKKMLGKICDELSKKYNNIVNYQNIIDYPNSNEQSDVIENLKAQLAASNDQIQELLVYKKRIEGIENLSQMTPEERLGIDERAIFISSAIGLDFDPKRTNQKQLSIMISKLTGDNPESIRGRISKMHKMEKNERFSDEVLQAARNVKGMLERIPQGNQPQKMKDIIANIDLVFLNSNKS